MFEETFDETSLEEFSDEIKVRLDVGFGYSVMLEVTVSVTMSVDVCEDEWLLEESFCLLNTATETKSAVETSIKATTVSTFFIFTLPFLQNSLCICIFFNIIP